MVKKLGSPEGLLGGFLAAYFALLLFCFSVSKDPGGVWLYVGLTSLVCCCAAFFGWFTRYNYRYHTKCLKNELLDREAFSGRRSQGQ
jgi:CDP-diglyceride synthetase